MNRQETHSGINHNFHRALDGLPTSKTLRSRNICLLCDCSSRTTTVKVVVDAGVSFLTIRRQFRNRELKPGVAAAADKPGC